jgi:hypothetical protein
MKTYDHRAKSLVIAFENIQVVVEVVTNFILAVKGPLDRSVNTRGSFTQEVIQEVQSLENALIKTTLFLEPLLEDFQVDGLRLADHEAETIGPVTDHLLFAVVADLDKNAAWVVIADGRPISGD